MCSDTVSEAAAAECAEAAKIKKAQCAARKIENSEDAGTDGDNEDDNPVMPKSLAFNYRSLLITSVVYDSYCHLKGYPY